MRANAGFTFLELMVVVTIGAILFGGAIAAYRGMGDKQTVKQAGATFQTNLRLFQQKAQASEKPQECGSGDVFSGYQVQYVDDSTYKATPLCQTAVPQGQEIKLPTKVKFLNPFQGDIIFSVLKSEIGGAQTITLVTGTVNYQVVIETGGVIRGNLL